MEPKVGFEPTTDGLRTPGLGRKRIGLTPTTVAETAFVGALTPQTFGDGGWEQQIRCHCWSVSWDGRDSGGFRTLAGCEGRDHGALSRGDPSPPTSTGIE